MLEVGSQKEGRDEVRGREGRLLLAQRVNKIHPSPRWVVAARRPGDSRKKDVLIIDGVRTMRRRTGEVSCIHRNQGII